MRRSSSPPPKRPRSADGPPPQDSLPPLSLSILGVEPLDEFIKEIADFVYHLIQTRPDHPKGKIEVEAKVGVLRDRTSNQRLALPVLVETILAWDIPNVRFESNMSMPQHKHYNTILNNLKIMSSQSSHPASPITYQHRNLVDSFYPHDGNDRERIRVTRDNNTKVVLEVTRKIRLGDLNIYSPKTAADWRVSVNLEIPVQHPIGSPLQTRRKDRMSYLHEEFSIDLTQVSTTVSGDVAPQISHELELEIARSELLMSTASKRNNQDYSMHERSAFDELIRVFVNNARILVRNSNGPISI